jgi:hypothetical protein
MSDTKFTKLLTPQNLAAGICILVSFAFLRSAWSFPGMSMMLPVAMLLAMILLSSAIIIRSYIAPVPETSGTPFFVAKRKFLSAVAIIIIYALAVEFVGFYTSTVIMVPVASWVFGYRSPAGIALATTIFVGGIALIFLVLMNRSFPTEFFLR